MGFSIGKIFKGVVNFGSKILGGAAGGFLGGGPLGALFGGLSGLTGGLLSKPKPDMPMSMTGQFPLPMNNDAQTSGLLGVINRLVSVLSNVVSGLLSKLTGGGAEQLQQGQPGNILPFAAQQDPLKNVA
jgi:hypothetical protein